MELDYWVVCYLQEEESLGNFLDELLWDILREELGSELKLQRVLFLHILLGHLDNKDNIIIPQSNQQVINYVWFGGYDKGEDLSQGRLTFLLSLSQVV